MSNGRPKMLTMLRSPRVMTSAAHGGQQDVRHETQRGRKPSRSEGGETAMDEYSGILRKSEWMFEGPSWARCKIA